MIALYHGSIAVGLAPFDDFRHITVNLKHKLFSIPVLYTSHSHIFQGDDTLRHILCSVLEVIQTTVVEDKPTPLPTFPAPSLNNGKKLNMSEMMNAQRCMAVRSETVLTPILQA